MAMDNTNKIEEMMNQGTIEIKPLAEVSEAVEVKTHTNDVDPNAAVILSARGNGKRSLQSWWDNYVRIVLGGVRNEAEIKATVGAEQKPEETPEEWIWITGYKGTEKDMKCRDQQYELGKLCQMPEDAEIVDCSSGYHLCRDLDDVYNYYSIGDGRRYFEVQALVRKKDYEEYGIRKRDGLFTRTRDKLVSKAIVFTRELTVDEILQADETINQRTKDWTPEQKAEAIETSIGMVTMKIQAAHLVTLGYSEGFAQYIIEYGKYDDAVKVASQISLSMDMKVLAILKGL